MPTFSQISRRGDTDIGWGVVRILAVDPDTLEPTLIEIECKRCRCKQPLTLPEMAGHQFGSFAHADDCKVLAEIRSHAIDTKQVPR